MKILWKEVKANLKQMVADLFDDDMLFSETEEDDMLFSETEEKELIVLLKQRFEKLK